MTATSMVEKFLRGQGLQDERVLRAMEKVQRHFFVPEALRERAYENYPLPIGDDQTISQPFIVALMTESLSLLGEEKVLEIGTGSGYQTALLAELSKSVFSVERIPKLAREARSTLESLGYHNISIRVADGTYGWQEFAPYDRIIVTASAPTLPDVLVSQLTEAGILVIPIGSVDRPQELFRYQKVNGKLEREFLCSCSFVPFVT